MPSFSSTLEQAIHHSLAFANARKHETATLEHLLLALIDEPDAAQALQACAVNLDALRETVTNFLDEDCTILISETEGSEATPTAAYQRIIQRAAIHVQSSGREEVTGANVLVAIFAERESNAAVFLQEQDMTRYDAVNYIAHGIAKNPLLSESRLNAVFEEEEEELLTEAEWREKYMPSRKKSESSIETSSLPEKGTPKPNSKRHTISNDPFVFLSYSSLDRELVTSFLSLLRKKDIPAWWDQDISPGATWRSEISTKLETSSVVLTLWTANSIISKPVIEEASTAQRKRKLVHIRMDDSTIPYGFGETQYVDLRDWDGTVIHPNFQRLIYAIQDKLATPTVEFASKRINQSSPMEIVAHEGRLAIKDAPSNMAPEVVNPVDFETRLIGLKQTLDSMCSICSDKTAFQLPHTLFHCLEALKLTLTTNPVTWYALEDAKFLLNNCMIDSNASEAWNTVVYKGLSSLIVRIDEIRPLLQPTQIDPETNEAKPPAPEPIINKEQVTEVADIAKDVLSELSSEEGREILDENTKQNLRSTVERIKELEKSIEPVERKLFKLRHALRGLAYLAGGIITAIGTGVIVNLLTAPTAAMTFLTRLKPIFESIMQFFL